MANRAQVKLAMHQALAAGATARDLEAKFLEITGQHSLSGEDTQLLAEYIAMAKRPKAAEPIAEVAEEPAKPARKAAKKKK